MNFRIIRKNIYMDIKWLFSRNFVVRGTEYTVQVPITLEEALVETQLALSGIKKKKEYYEGLLKKLDFSDSFLDKAPIKIIIDKIKIEEDTYKMLFFLTEEEYKYSIQLKIILRLIFLVEGAYYRLNYKIKQSILTNLD